jgi:hypothetical protein
MGGSEGWLVDAWNRAAGSAVGKDERKDLLPGGKEKRNYSAIPNRPHDAEFDYNGMPINNLHQNEKRYPMPRSLEVSFLELATRDL